MLLLLLIPCAVLLSNFAMSGESGVVHIVICNEGEDAAAEEIVSSLMNGDTVVRFSRCDSSDVAERAVANNEADGAWIFSENFTDMMREHIARGESDEPFIRVVEREPTVFLRIAKEKLFGAIYSDFSYAIYEDFVYSRIVSEDEVPKETVREYYERLQRGNNIVEIEHLNEKSVEYKENINYLNAPMRGILALMTVLCTLAAAMCFLKEQAMGKFSWLPVSRRIVPSLASCFSAALLSATAVVVTVHFMGISTGIVNEICAMLLYVLSTAGFCTVLSMFFRSSGKFGATIPGIMITMFALSPIFLNVQVLKPIRLLLPTHYYLQTVYDPNYYVYAIIYCVAVYAVGFLLNVFISKRKYFVAEV